LGHRIGNFQKYQVQNWADLKIQISRLAGPMPTSAFMTISITKLTDLRRVDRKNSGSRKCMAGLVDQCLQFFGGYGFMARV